MRDRSLAGHMGYYGALGPAIHMAKAKKAAVKKSAVKVMVKAVKKGMKKGKAC